ncbi:MAG: T9SS type A sorting domain-containing protein [Bacteroidota bacterium]
MNKKSTLKKALILGMFCGIQQLSFAQTIFTEDFEGTLDGTTGLPNGWTETGVSTDGIYSVGTDIEANAGNFFPVPAHTLFAMTNDDVCNCDKSADRLILPAQDLSSYTGSALRLYFSTVSDNQYGETFSVELSTDGGLNWTTVQTIVPTASTYEWQDLNTNLTSYVGMPNVLISFFYNDQSAWGSGMAIDDVSLVLATPVADLAIISNNSNPYTIVPVSQSPVFDIVSNITNNGDLILANYSEVSNVYLSTDLISPVQTYTYNGTNLGVGSSEVVTQGTFSSTVTGTYFVENIVSTAGDINTTNDTIYDSFVISNTEYARDLGNINAPALGAGLGTELILGQTFDITNNAKLDSVLFLLAPTTVGGTISVQVTSVIGGLPDLTVIGMSADIPVDQAMVDDVTANGVTLLKLAITDINGQNLILTPGAYFIGVKQDNAVDFMNLQYSDGIALQGTSFVSVDGAAYEELSTYGFPNVPLIRAYVLTGVFINSSSTTNIICGGSGSVTLSSTESTGNQWMLDGNPLAGEVNQTLVATVAGDYTVSANGNTSTPTTIVVAANPTVDAGTDQTVCDNVMITLTASGASTFVWDNSIVDNTPFSQVAGTVTYTVIGTDLNGCTNTDQVTVISNASPVISAGVDQAVCANTSVTLTGSGGTTYTWDNSVVDAVAFTPTNTTTYTVTSIDANLCADTDQVTVTINALPTVDGGIDQTVCLTGMVTLTASGATTLTWDNAVVNAVAFNAPAVTTTYTVTGTDVNNCSNTDQVTINVTDCAGLTEQENSFLNVYPNPTTGILNISIENTEIFNTINVKDQLGRNVMNTMTLTNNSLNIDLSKLANGNYFVEFSGKEKVSVVKVQVNK